MLPQSSKTACITSESGDKPIYAYVLQIIYVKACEGPADIQPITYRNKEQKLFKSKVCVKEKAPAKRKV